MRRHVTLYLGPLELAALDACPETTTRGRWIRTLAGQLAAWNSDAWQDLLHALAPRPRHPVDRLNISLPGELGAALDQRRGGVPLSEVLRTALLKAAGVDYQPLPMVPVPGRRGAGKGDADQPTTLRGPASDKARPPVPRPLPRITIEDADDELRQQLRSTAAEGRLAPLDCAANERDAVRLLEDWVRSARPGDSRLIFIGVQTEGPRARLVPLAAEAEPLSMIRRWAARHAAVSLEATRFRFGRLGVVLAVTARRA